MLQTVTLTYSLLALLQTLFSINIQCFPGVYVVMGILPAKYLVLGYAGGPTCRPYLRPSLHNQGSCQAAAYSHHSRDSDTALHNEAGSDSLTPTFPPRILCS
jgi:hypothetical protein